MSNPASPSRPARLKPFGEVITDERRCPECDYDLRGLRLGGKCPECGEPISIAAAIGSQLRLRDHFAPLFFVDCLGFFVFGIAGAMLPLGLIGARFLPNLTPAQLLAQNLLLSLVWLLGVVMLLRAHQRATPHGSGVFAEFVPYTRLSAVVSQALLPALAILMHYYTTTATPALGWFAGLLSIVIAAGWVPVALLLSGYAEHYGDSPLAGRFRSIAWTLAVFGVGTLLVIFLGWLNTGFSTLVRMFGWLVVAVWAFSFIAMCFSTLQVANTVRWAYVNTKAAQARDDRLRAKAKQAAESERPPALPTDAMPDPALLAKLEAAPTHTNPSPNDSHAPHLNPGDRVIAKSADSPYRLETED
jgi:hypothetical protein